MTSRITRIRYGSGVGDVIDFTEPTSGYKIVIDGYRPKVAKRKRGVLGGEQVTRVIDTMLLTVSGANANEANDRVELLNSVISQAELWRSGASVHVVTIEYRVEGSVLVNPLQAAITGQPSGGDVVQLPLNYDSATSETVIGSADDPLIFSFERRGEWLGDEEAQVISSAAENPVINTAAFGGTLTAPGAVKLDIEYKAGGGVSDTEAFVFVADDVDKLYLSKTLVGNIGSSTSVITASHADADASANETLMIQPNDTNTVRVIPVTTHTFPAGSGMLMFFLVVRNNSNSVYWDISQIWYNPPGSGVTKIKTFDNVRIEAGASIPHIITIGPLFFEPLPRMDSSRPNFLLTPSAGAGSGHELEVDTIAIVNLGTGVTILATDDANFSMGDTHTEIDHALLSRLKPYLYAGQIGASTNDRSIGYKGVPYIYNNTTEIATLVLGVQDDNWILSGDPGSGYQPVTVGIKATRSPVYLVPR